MVERGEGTPLDMVVRPNRSSLKLFYLFIDPLLDMVVRPNRSSLKLFSYFLFIDPPPLHTHGCSSKVHVRSNFFLSLTPPPSHMVVRPNSL